MKIARTGEAAFRFELDIVGWGTNVMDDESAATITIHPARLDETDIVITGTAREVRKFANDLARMMRKKKKS